jgi:hypothetical protein
MKNTKHKLSKRDHELAEWLRSRFYHVREMSGQTTYYDAETGVRTLTKMHLVQHLISNGMEAPCDDPLGHGREIINSIFFTPIVLEAVYLPSEPAVVAIEGNWHPNLWCKPNVEPNAAISAQPFTEHLERMLGTKAKADYLLNMVAYRYQNPRMQSDKKPHVAFYFYGDKHGYGKGLFAGTLEAVFGESAVAKVIDQAALNSMSAVDVWTRTWAIVEEVDVKKGSTDYNKLKTMIGGGAFNAARKGEHFRKHEAPAQLFMLSNHAPNFIEPNDRRFFISEWLTHFDTDSDKNNYFSEYAQWLKAEGGYSAIANLLATRDISKVRVESPAMMTDEKKAVIALMTDRVVEELKLIMQQQPDAVCFTAGSFASVWQDFDISKAQQIYKLAEAGLTRTPKKRYQSKTHEFWIKKGWVLEAVNGKKPILRNDTDLLAKDLYEDYGYKAEVEF